ncbi:MAG TPA: hypothetical protein VFS99_05550 [Xanthomonadaceae bacterium]|nr:hypothetical protein [Xanthomonadaceae bacterium]
MKKTTLLFGLLFSAAAVAACVYGGAQAAPVEIDADNLQSEDAWRQIGDALESQFGNALVSLEGSVIVPVKIPGSPYVPMKMSKLCGETMKEAANRIADGAAVTYGATGGGGAPGYYYGGGYYGSGCLAGCQTGTVTVGDPERADS